jgi:acetylornithine deacetylase/succinyl-diaminopimelate desuccinylase family protein
MSSTSDTAALTARVVEPASLTDFETRVLERLDESRLRLEELLRSLVSFETPNPPGANEGEAQAWVGDRLQELGMTVETFDALPGRPNVVGLLRGHGGSGRSLLFNGHIDVAELRNADAWSYPPFGGVVENGRMYGLGTSDMKSAHAGFLLALECLRDLDCRLGGDVVYESVIGEERGEPGTQACIRRGISADFAIVGECSKAEAIFVTSVGITNACVTLSEPASRHLIHRRLMLRAGGQLRAANCIEKMATKILPALLELEQEWGVYKEHPQLPLGQALINVFSIEGGGNTFILPDECRMYFTVVYLPGEDLDQVRAEVERKLGLVAASDSWLADHPPHVQWDPAPFPINFLPIDGRPDDAATALLAGCLGVVTGRAPVVAGRDAIMDGGWLHQAGIPTVVFGPGDKRVIHSPDEYVELDDVLVFAKTVALFLLRWCGNQIPSQNREGGRLA